MKAALAGTATTLAVLAVLAAPASATTHDQGTAAKLRPGKAAFWTGPFVERSGPASAEQISDPMMIILSTGAAGSTVCESPATECFRYALDIDAGGTRLRAAIDHPDLVDTFGIELRDPTGRVVAYEDGTNLEGALPRYSEEVLADTPVPGRWTVTVVGHDVYRSGFRMRAKLERPKAGLGGADRVRDLLPNVRVTPPFQVGFAPCQQSEIDNYGAVKCLRFSEGPENVGDGPLELISADTGELTTRGDEGDFIVGDQHQVVRRSDGTTTEFPAGRYEFHLEHRHFHHTGTGNFELLRVTDPVAGTLEDAGSGPKIGSCMGDYLIADWSSFDVDRPRTSAELFAPRNCFVPGAMGIGLSRGWADVYPWFIEAQYVEFGRNPKTGAMNPDGLYLIRATAFPLGDIHETDTTDNAGYAYVRVTGDEVDVLERGYGRSPWDPAKQVATDIRQPELGSAKTVG